MLALLFYLYFQQQVVRVRVYFASKKRNCCDSILVIRFVTCHSITSLPARRASQESFSFSFLSVNFSDQDCKIDYILRLTLIIKERVGNMDKMLQHNYFISCLWRLILFRWVYNCVSLYLSATSRVKKLKGSELAGPAWSLSWSIIN